MARYQADMLQRMRISLMAFCYVIEHVPGDQNDETEIHDLQNGVRTKVFSLVLEDVEYDEERQLLIGKGNTVWSLEDTMERQ
ncbi:hypothetical protein GN244_ATG14358 [Phytophthora infestans]|uniref:Uncharacterized protein n=1 Tax=Phytophthora infestans TaxID=4787 RepID=A0A833VY99_PHYIN|nr:hypothetical protein GN244_ATG14358 [Phytophthora infestans]